MPKIELWSIVFLLRPCCFIIHAFDVQRSFVLTGAVHVYVYFRSSALFLWTRGCLASLSAVAIKREPFFCFQPSFSILITLRPQPQRHRESHQQNQIIGSRIGCALLWYSGLLSHNSWGGIVGWWEEKGVVVVLCLWKESINLRTSHLAALLQSCTSFPLSQGSFVSQELPVIAIRFDFTSFFRTEKEESWSCTVAFHEPLSPSLPLR